jgi:alpha-tubulin suppressor-like RCC1 family protein
MNRTHFVIANYPGNEVYSCGANRDCQLGTGNDQDQLQPVKILLPVNLICISAGSSAPMYHSSYTVAVGEDESLWSWGNNSCGQLGLGESVTPVTVPAQIPHTRSFVSVSSGSLFILALDSQGSVWSCGSNQYGQLGVGDFINRRTPTQIRDVPCIQMVSASEYRGVILDINGLMWSFGSNCVGNATQRCYPCEILGVKDIVEISSGSHHTLALDSLGGVWSFGYNGYGQLGLGNNESKFPPEKIARLAPIIHVWCGETSSYIQDDEYHVLVFGDNEHSQLALDPSIRTQLVPCENPRLFNTRIIPGGFHALAVDQHEDVLFFGVLTDADYEPLPNQPNEHLGINIGRRISTKSARSSIK